jgi:hypothetical protein
MTPRLATLLAVPLWTVAISLAVCGVGLRYVNDDMQNASLVLISLMVLATIASLATVGALLIVHRPENPIGWIFLVTAISIDFSLVGSEYGKYITETAPGALPENTLLFWIAAWSYLLVFLLPATFGILLFPTGRLPSRRWRPFACLAGVWLFLLVLAEMLASGPLDPEPDGSFSQVTNPVSVESLAWVVSLVEGIDDAIPLTPFILLGAVASIFIRLRSATVAERQQIKWFAYAATIPFMGMILEQAIYALNDSKTLGDETAGSFLWIFGIAVLPVATGIAILRHNLYDIDRLINRTLVYGLLTAALLASYLSLVVGLGVIVQSITGGSSSVVVAISTLVVAALFRPLRAYSQQFVDRRFYRAKYDAALTLERFSEHLSNQVDLNALSHELKSVVSATMQPSHVSIWLQPACKSDWKERNSNTVRP